MIPNRNRRKPEKPAGPDLKPCRASGGKITFANRKKALSEMNAIRARRRKEGRPDDAPVEVYRCRFCPGWHLSSNATWDPRRLK